MIDRKFRLLYEESLVYKDAGMLSSALEKRREATALMLHDKGHYALGKANEAILLGYHIGDGLAAFAAAKESLKDIDAFKKTATEWERTTGLTPFKDIFNIIRQWSESYETCIEYNRLRTKYFPSIETVQNLSEIEKASKEEPIWWRTQMAIAYDYYSRERPEMDNGLYGQGMSILQCILERANNEEAGYILEYDEYIHILDDYVMISNMHFNMVLQKYQAKYGQANTPANSNELFIILKNVIKVWKDFVPEMREKDKILFTEYYQMYWLMLAMLHRQDEMKPLNEYFPEALMQCPNCGKQIPKISPMCRYCQKMIGFGNTQSKSGLPQTPDFSRMINPESTILRKQPPGCLVAIIIGLFISATLWWW